MFYKSTWIEATSTAESSARDQWLVVARIEARVASST